MKSKTHFAFRIDSGMTLAGSIVEHVVNAPQVTISNVISPLWLGMILVGANPRRVTLSP